MSAESGHLIPAGDALEALSASLETFSQVTAPARELVAAVGAAQSSFLLPMQQTFAQGRIGGGVSASWHAEGAPWFAAQTAIAEVLKTYAAVGGIVENLSLPQLGFSPDAIPAVARFSPFVPPLLTSFSGLASDANVYLGGMTELLRQNENLSRYGAWLPGYAAMRTDIARVQSLVSTRENLNDAVSAVMRAAHTPGALGFNYRGVANSAEAVSRELELNPELAEEIEESLSDTLEASGLDDEVLFDMGEALGWWKVIRSHRVSTAGLILGTSVSLTHFVGGLGSGDTTPQSVMASLAMGAGMYLFIASRRPGPSEDPPD